MAFDIYTDSAANLPDGERIAHDVRVVPYSYTVDGEEFSCVDDSIGFSENAKRFYEKMKAGAECKTSLISCDKFMTAMIPSLEAGRDVILITIASGISGTYNQAVAAQKELSERYPDRTIIVKDSANASMGQGLLVLKIAALREMGESLETCAKWLDENTYKLNSYVTAGDLKYLRRSGRVSLPLAIAGTLLNIKPILKADGGASAKLVFAGREHGRKKALSALLNAFRENAVHPENQTVAITHADAEEEALALAEAVRELGARDVIVEYYDLCTGSHIGPGTVALFFMGKDRKNPSAAAEKATRAKPAVNPVK